MAKGGSTADTDGLPAWTGCAVFLYGPRKGGTTMLQNLLDGGDELLVYPAELNLQRLAWVLWRSGDAWQQYRAAAAHHEPGYPNFDMDRYRELSDEAAAARYGDLRTMLRRDVANVHDAVIQKPRSLRMWAMKLPGGHTPEVVGLFRQLFFDGKIVMIVRDPLMATRSILRNARRRGVRHPAWKIAADTAESLRVLRHQVRLMEDPSIHVVAYEDLTGGDTTAEIRAICDFLGIEHTPVLERTTVFGEPVVAATASREDTGVFRSDARSWRDGLTLREQSVVLTTWLAMSAYFRLLSREVVDYGALRARRATRPAA